MPVDAFVGPARESGTTLESDKSRIMRRSGSYYARWSKVLLLTSNNRNPAPIERSVRVNPLSLRVMVLEWIPQQEWALVSAVQP
jgi:hypothetical protein